MDAGGVRDKTVHGAVGNVSIAYSFFPPPILLDMSYEHKSIACATGGDAIYNYCVIRGTDPGALIIGNYNRFIGCSDFSGSGNYTIFDGCDDFSWTGNYCYVNEYSSNGHLTGDRNVIKGTDCSSCGKHNRYASQSSVAARRAKRAANANGLVGPSR